MIDETSVYGRWPITRAEDWCGDGEPADPPEEDGKTRREDLLTKADLVTLKLVRDKDSV